MSKFKTVEHTTCESTGKPSFANEHLARKALGRAQAQRAVKGTRRVGRVFECEHCHGWHLTGRPRVVADYMADELARIAAECLAGIDLEEPQRITPVTHAYFQQAGVAA